MHELARSSANGRHGLAECGLTKRVPIFLISAETSPAVTQEAYGLGVMDVVEKPVVPT